MDIEAKDEVSRKPPEDNKQKNLNKQKKEETFSGSFSLT
jgi:hypothetical protein